MRTRLAVLRPWLVALLVVCALIIVVTRCDEFRLSVATPNEIPTESYRPDPADVVAEPSCLLPDIVARLSTSSFDVWATRPRPGEGSIPRRFAPTGLVRCEVGETAVGRTTIDEVRLAGDVTTVSKELNRPSLRADDSVSVDCAEIPYAPAALWLTSAAGAIRVQWPAKPCDIQDEPQKPLDALTEVSRRTVMTLDAPPTRPCGDDFTRELGRPTRPDDVASKPVTRRPVVRLPSRTLAATTFCRYRLTGSTTGRDNELIGQTRLSSTASAQLLRDASAAPAAPPCDRPATEVVGAGLFRPDGSGGANLTVELDGCRRLTVAFFTTIRTAPAALIDQLSR